MALSSRDKEKYSWGGIGLAVGVLACAFLPEEFNPATVIKNQFGGLI